LSEAGASADRCDVAIVGAGAAGLATAIFAGEAAPGRRIVVLEGADKVGAKILISGGGRCNVTHDVVRPEDFNGPRPVVRNILAAFDAAAAVRWFAALGVELEREETGKLFPVSDKARTVLEALLRRCAGLGVEIRTGQRVAAVEGDGDAFLVRHARGSLAAARLVLATGGRSLPRTGSDGSGWEIARRLGHSVSATYPALVPLVLEGGFHGELSGVSQEVELSTFASGRLIDRRRGSLLWTHFGISGPVVLDASRHWVIAHARGEKPEIRCSFLPGRAFEALEKEWLAAARRGRVSVRRLIGAEIPERAAEALARGAGIEPGASATELSRTQRRALLHQLLEYRLPVVRDRGWDFAEVSAGGVPLAEIDYRSMRSRLVRGLFLVGEMLDCDGRIGGFNFQWAWATGSLAGRALAEVGGGSPHPAPHGAATLSPLSRER
jgi:predicted Rossmann fold flavoprotein